MCWDTKVEIASQMGTASVGRQRPDRSSRSACVVRWSMALLRWSRWRRGPAPRPRWRRGLGATV